MLSFAPAVYFHRYWMILCRPMAAFSSILNWVVAPTTIFLELALCSVAWRCRLYRQLAFFSAYIVLVTIEEFSGWWVSKTPWFHSDTYYYIFWSTQLALSLLRLLTIAEIARRSLRGYRAIWALAWQTLSAAAFVLLSWTAYSTVPYVHHVKRFIAIGGQRFEFMQAILLLLVMVLGAYYHLHVAALYRLILIGMCICSAEAVTSSQLYLLNNNRLAESIFGYIRQGYYPIPLAIWIYAVWRWGAASIAPPDLITQEKYDELSPQVHDRLRELNDKLAKLSGERDK